MALVVQDLKSFTRAPSVPDAFHVFRARPVGNQLLSSQTCELYIVVLVVNMLPTLVQPDQ